jgi:hypothetical protein
MGQRRVEQRGEALLRIIRAYREDGDPVEQRGSPEESVDMSG